MKPISAIVYGRTAPGLPVSDIGKACAFYADVLGFRKTFENGDPVGFVILKKDAAELHLSLAKGHRASTLNLAHLLVDDVDALHDICVAAGVRIIKSLADKDYGLRAFVFADPDGNRIDVGQRTAGATESAPGRFEGQDLKAATFHDCSLAAARFDDVDLSDAVFSKVSLRQAKLANVNFAGASIEDADLSEAVFADVNLRQARLTNVNLAGACIDDANIEGLQVLGYDIQALIRAERARNASG